METSRLDVLEMHPGAFVVEAQHLQPHAFVVYLSERATKWVGRGYSAREAWFNTRARLDRQPASGEEV